MNERSRRIERVLRLREQQHARKEVALRTAQLELCRQSEALLSANQDVRVARGSESLSMQGGNTHGRLLALAEAEAARMMVSHYSVLREAAQQRVDESVASERAARVRSRQIAAVVERTRQLDERAAAYREQMRLDEVARNLRTFSRAGYPPASMV